MLNHQEEQYEYRIDIANTLNKSQLKDLATLHIREIVETEKLLDRLMMHYHATHDHDLAILNKQAMIKQYNDVKFFFHQSNEILVREFNK